MALFLISIVFLFSTLSWAEGGCYSEHLHEAIALNTERAPLYALVSNGKSSVISKQWILSEKGALYLGDLLSLDKKAEIYEKAGVPILCGGFVAMNEVPEFSALFLNGAPIKADYELPRLWKLRVEIKKALEKNDFQKAWNLAALKINELNKETRFNCMSRHVVESVARFIGQAESLNKKALSKGLPSSLPLSKELILWQMQGFLFSQSLDFQASKIQQMGVPFICNDVPMIEYPYLTN